MGGLTARSFAGIDDPFSGRRLKNTTRARARPPAPALGAGALGPEGLGPLGALGHLGAWARARDVPQPC